MKALKIISSAVFVLLTTAAVSNAQMNRVRDSEYFPRSEVYVQYGTPSVVELTTILQSEYRAGGYMGDSRNYKFSGTAALGYAFYVHPRVSVGVDFGYGYGSADLYVTASDMSPLPGPVFVCRSSVSTYSAHISASYTYWQSGPMECSGSLYLGVCWKDESVIRKNDSYTVPDAEDRLGFSYHITAVKFRYGETLGGFAELGFGCRGLVNVGLSIKI